MDESVKLRVNLSIEEMNYIVEALGLFPTINAYGNEAIRIEDRINKELTTAMEEYEDGDTSRVVNDDYSDELEDEVYPEEEE